MGFVTPVTDFIARIDYLEERYKRDRHQRDLWLMPVPMLKAVRDELKRHADLPIIEEITA